MELQDRIKEPIATREPEIEQRTESAPTPEIEQRPESVKSQESEQRTESAPIPEIEKNPSSITVIPNPTPPELRELSELSILSLSKLSNMSDLTVSNLSSPSSTVKNDTPDIIAQRSYSPEINKQLVSMKSRVRERLGLSSDCYSSGDKIPKINVAPLLYGADSGNIKCKNATTKVAQQLLLQNLSSKDIVPLERLLAPKQHDFNCWFNAMFMSFFVSDKGRKFFRFFRQLMIQGKTINGTKIKPALWSAFLHLNIYIDGVLSGESSLNQEHELDTNVIIDKIHKAIPAKYRGTAIQRPGMPHNPLSEYFGIINYLGEYSLGYHTLMIGDNLDKRPMQDINIPPPENTHVIIVEIMDEKDDKTQTNITEKPLNIEYPDGRKYVLDSVSIRDITRNHMCSLITYDKKECGFDGGSYKRLSEYKWKELINKDEDWTFEGSVWEDTGTPIIWNFKNGYQILYYYLTNP